MDDLTIWIGIGVLSLILEVVVPAFGFLAAFLASIIVSLIIMIKPDAIVFNQQIMIFSGLSVLFVLVLYKFLYSKSEADYHDPILGSKVKVLTIPGASGDRIFYTVSWSGSIFNAKALSDKNIEPGDILVVDSIDGSVLTIKESGL